MKVIIQKVAHAAVKVDGNIVGAIDQGLLLFIGIGNDDGEEDMSWLTRKILNMRIFLDENGVMNKSIKEVNGDILAISQFTLMASTKKGNRPSYIHAARPEVSKPIYEQFCTLLSKDFSGKVEKGVFGAHMKVSLLNDGPVTIQLDSKLRM